MQDEYLRFPAVHHAVKLSRSTLWRLEQTGAFPLRRQLSEHAVGWLKSEVAAWIADCKNPKDYAVDKAKHAVNTKPKQAYPKKGGA